MFGLDAGIANRWTQKFRGEDRKWTMEDREYDRSKFQRLSADAKKAGIHPLFAMGASIQNSQPTQTHQQGASGGDIGRSIQAMGQNKTQALQNELLNAQIQQVQTDTKLANQELNRVNPTTNTDKTIIDGHEVKLPSTTKGHLNFLGIPIELPKGMTDAQSFEDVFGEAGGFAGGSANALQTWNHNVTKRIIKYNQDFNNLSAEKGKQLYNYLKSLW